MMQVINCKQCGNSSLPFGNVSVSLDLVKSNYCEHCRKSETQKQYYFFCSIGCLVEYMKQVLDGNKELKWKE